MKVLIIGGNGFIGSHLIDEMLKNGHQVVVYDLAYERFRQPLENVEYAIGSLDKIEFFKETLTGIDIVYHLASGSVPSTSNVDAISDVQGNLISTLNVVNACVEKGIKRFVYFSSGGAVYGPSTENIISEEHILKPISSYGILKVTIENYLHLYEKLYGLKTLIIRPSNPFGIRQGNFGAQGVISTFLKKTMLGEPLVIFGDGQSTKDYIFIRDLIKITYNLSMKFEHGVFNVGRGKGLSLLSIISHITEVTKIKPELNFTDFKNYDVSNFVLDIQKLDKALGGVSFTDFEQGIEETWNWINTLK
jgi:UDP-glucose 4-epimerase